jgi:lipopolysaccharide transport system permease protein
MFASPVVYPASVVPQKWQWILLINPVAAILEGFRAALTGSPIDWLHLLIASAIILLVLIIALYVFRRAEDGFVDVI